MVMVSPKLMPQATWEFEAEILVLHHPTTISPRYQAMGEWHRREIPLNLIVALKSLAKARTHKIHLVTLKHSNQE